MVELLANKIRTFIKFKPGMTVAKERIKNMAIKLYQELRPIVEKASYELSRFMGKSLHKFSTSHKFWKVMIMEL